MAEPSPGPIVLSTDVEIAVRDTLKRWVPFYLADIDEQQERPRGTTKPPKKWDIASEDSARWLEATPPALVVACPGTIGDPQLHGDHASYGAWWQINVGVTASGASTAGSLDLAGRLAGAVRYVFGQQGDMGGLAVTTKWRGERSNIAARDRKLAVAEIVGAVYIGRVLDTRGLLPRDLPADPTQPADPTPVPTGTRIVVRPR